MKWKNLLRIHTVLVVLSLALAGNSTVAYGDDSHSKTYKDSEVSDAMVYNQIFIRKALRDPEVSEKRNRWQIADRSLDGFCDKVLKDNSLGTLDPIELAEILQKAEDAIYDGLERAYTREYGLMNAAEKRECDEEMARIRRNGVSYTRFDWVAMAKDMPEGFGQNLVNSCRAQAGDFSLFNQPSVGRRKPSTSKRDGETE